MLALIAMVTVGAATQEPAALDRAITFESPGASIKETARQLTLASGFTVRVANSLDHETLVIRVREKPVRQLLDLIKDVLVADWKVEQGEVVLFRSTEQAKKQETDELEMRLLALKKWQDAPLPEPWTKEKAAQLIAQAESIAQLSDPRQNQTALRERMNLLSKQTPEYRASLVLRRQVDLKALAAAGPGNRVVISSRPNRLQKELKGAEPAIRTFEKERAEFQAMAQASLARVPETNNIRDLRRDSARANSRPDRAMFVAYRLGEYPGLSIRSYMISGSTILSMAMDPVDLFPAVRPPLPKVAFDSPEAAALIQSFMERDLEKMRSLLPAGDPISWAIGPTLCRYSEALGKDVVAVIPDAVVTRNMYRPIAKDAYPYLATCLDRDCSWEERNGAILIRPYNPVLTRAGYMNRERYFAFIKGLEKDQHLSLEAAGEYAANEPPEVPADAILGAGVYAATGESSGSILDVFTSPMTRFWGRLQPIQRTGRTTFGLLSTSAKTAMAEWFFHTTMALQGTTVDQADPNSGWQIWRLEPTELFPNGIPDELEIDCAVNEIPIMWRQQAGNQYYERLEHVGWWIEDLENAEVKFAQSKTRSLAIKLKHRAWSSQVDIDEPAPSKGLKWVTGKELDSKTVETMRANRAREKAQENTVKRIPPP